MSLVAKTQATDPDIASGGIVLDQMIDDAINMFRDALTAEPIIP